VDCSIGLRIRQRFRHYLVASSIRQTATTMTQPATHRLCVLRSFRLIISQEPSQTCRSEGKSPGRGIGVICSTEPYLPRSDPHLFPLYPIVQLLPRSSQSISSVISDLVLQASLTSRVPSNHGRPDRGQLQGQSVITPILKTGKDTDEIMIVFVFSDMAIRLARPDGEYQLEFTLWETEGYFFPLWSF
jgi:hypothetical protein